MKITDKSLVKQGNWITFRSRHNGTATRKFYRIESINNFNYNCKTYPRTEYNYDNSDFYDTVIDNLFECPDDEVFETLYDCQVAYPEAFL